MIGFTRRDRQVGGHLTLDTYTTVLIRRVTFVMYLGLAYDVCVLNKLPKLHGVSSEMVMGLALLALLRLPEMPSNAMAYYCLHCSFLLIFNLPLLMTINLNVPTMSSLDMWYMLCEMGVLLSGEVLYLLIITGKLKAKNRQAKGTLLDMENESVLINKAPRRSKRLAVLIKPDDDAASTTSTASSTSSTLTMTPTFARSVCNFVVTTIIGVCLIVFIVALTVVTNMFLLYCLNPRGEAVAISAFVNFALAGVSILLAVLSPPGAGPDYCLIAFIRRLLNLFTAIQPRRVEGQTQRRRGLQRLANAVNAALYEFYVIVNASAIVALPIMVINFIYAEWGPSSFTALFSN